MWIACFCFWLFSMGEAGKMPASMQIIWQQHITFSMQWERMRADDDFQVGKFTRVSCYYCGSVVMLFALQTL